MRTRPWFSTLLMLLLLAAGCSSTSKTESSKTTSGGEESTVAGDQARGLGKTTAAGTSGRASRFRSSGSTGTGAIGGGEAGTAPVVAGGGPVRMGRGVTAKEIKIGFNITKNLQAGFAAVGFRGSGQGAEERPIVESLVKYMNANGGIARRKIVPVFYEYDAASAQTWDAMAEEACSKFVDDEKVFGVVSGHVGQTDTLLACLAKGRTPLVQQNQWPYDGWYFSRYAGWLYQPSRMRPERWVQQYIDGLRDAGYFSSGHKLGLIRFDAPVFVRIEGMIRRTLQARGLKLSAVSVIDTPQSVGEFGGMASQLNNTILQFSNQGITHVIFDEYGAIIPFFFLGQAESQGYRPRYGFTSVNLAGTLEQQHGRGQLHGALTVSWLPGQDFSKEAARDPRTGKGGAHDKCLKIIRDALNEPPSRLYAGTHCDNLFFLQQAFASTNDITVDGLKAALADIGTSYDSPYTWSTRLGSGRPDGASKTMLGIYNDTCECFRFSGKLRDAG